LAEEIANRLYMQQRFSPVERSLPAARRATSVQPMVAIRSE
jgi:hypothetical protein